MSDPALLDAAESLLDSPHPDTAGLWSRSAALLARQALEAAVDAAWADRAPAMLDASMRARLICLPEALPDRALAAEASYAWAALSGACHTHDYDLPPTREELLPLIATARRLGDAVAPA